MCGIVFESYFESWEQLSRRVDENTPFLCVRVSVHIVRGLRRSPFWYSTCLCTGDLPPRTSSKGCLQQHNTTTTTTKYRQEKRQSTTHSCFLRNGMAINLLSHLLPFLSIRIGQRWRPYTRNRAFIYVHKRKFEASTIKNVFHNSLCALVSHRG